MSDGTMTIPTDLKWAGGAGDLTEPEKIAFEYWPAGTVDVLQARIDDLEKALDRTIDAAADDYTACGDFLEEMILICRGTTPAQSLAHITAQALRDAVDRMNDTNGAGSAFAAGYRSAQRAIRDHADRIENETL